MLTNNKLHGSSLSVVKFLASRCTKDILCIIS